MAPALQTVLICGVLPDAEIQRIKQAFKTVFYLPTNKEYISPEDVKKVEVLYCHNWQGFPECIKSLDEMPDFKFLQLSATGCDMIMKQAPVVSATPERLAQLAFANAAGGYSTQIGLYVLYYITSLCNSLQNITHLARTNQRWPGLEEIMINAGRSGPYGSKTMFGKTFGFLGYGSLGREFARLCTIFPKARIIAANTNGTKSRNQIFALPGTGDLEGDLPEKYYAAADPASLREFLSECDVLVCSMPGTAQTQWMLDAELLGLLKPNALFINVGRGSLIKSDEILKALEKPDGLLGVAIDVTDPEPLTDGHPLYTHPRVIVTPHCSGEAEDELIASTDILLKNTELLRSGQDYFNHISFIKGY